MGKKITFFIISAFVLTAPLGFVRASTVMSDESGALTWPTAASFAAQNSLATTSQLALKADASALSGYVTTTSFTSTLSNYPTTATVSGTYATQFFVITNFLKQTDAANTYLSVEAWIANEPAYFAVEVDMSPCSAYRNGSPIEFNPTDVELKVMYGSLLKYWGSSILAHQQSYVEGTDGGVEMWFTSSSLADENDTYGFRRSPMPFIRNIFSSIYEQVNMLKVAGRPVEVNGLVIYPNVAGWSTTMEYLFSTVWSADNAQLRPVVMRFDATGSEDNSSGVGRWKAVLPVRVKTRPTYYTFVGQTSLNWVQVSGTSTRNANGSVALLLGTVRPNITSSNYGRYILIKATITIPAGAHIYINGTITGIENGGGLTADNYSATAVTKTVYGLFYNTVYGTGTASITFNASMTGASISNVRIYTW